MVVDLERKTPPRLDQAQPYSTSHLRGRGPWRLHNPSWLAATQNGNQHRPQGHRHRCCSDECTYVFAILTRQLRHPGTQTGLVIVRLANPKVQVAAAEDKDGLQHRDDNPAAGLAMVWRNVNAVIEGRLYLGK
jgi:hypothetical protein